MYFAKLTICSLGCEAHPSSSRLTPALKLRSLRSCARTSRVTGGDRRSPHPPYPAPQFLHLSLATQLVVWHPNGSWDLRLGISGCYPGAQPTSVIEEPLLSPPPPPPSFRRRRRRLNPSVISQLSRPARHFILNVAAWLRRTSMVPSCGVRGVGCLFGVPPPSTLHWQRQPYRHISLAFASGRPAMRTPFVGGRGRECPSLAVYERPMLALASVLTR